MDDDVAQRPGQADIFRARGEGVVGVRVVGDEDEIVILRVRDQSELLRTHLFRELGQVFSGERPGEVLKAHLFAPHRFKVDHNRMESALGSNDSIESLYTSQRIDRLAAGLGEATARMQSLLRKD